MCSGLVAGGYLLRKHWDDINKEFEEFEKVPARARTAAWRPTRLAVCMSLDQNLLTVQLVQEAMCRLAGPHVSTRTQAHTVVYRDRFSPSRG